MTERTDWTFLGRKLGTITGWDGDLEQFTLYDFVPVEGFAKAAGDMNVDITKGLFEIFDNDGTMLWQSDIVEAVMTLPRMQDISNE